MSQGIALEGMRLVKEYLPRAYADGADIEARAHMMSAAAMGATAFQKGLGAIHALSHPIGAHPHTHHGTTNAVCMPAVLKFNAPAIADRFDAAAAYLGIEGGFEGFAALRALALPEGGPVERHWAGLPRRRGRPGAGWPEPERPEERRQPSRALPARRSVTRPAMAKARSGKAAGAGTADTG
jgi:hypothetical protein